MRTSRRAWTGGFALLVSLVLWSGAAAPARAVGIPIGVTLDGFDLAQFPTVSADYVVQSPLDWLTSGARQFNDPQNPFTLLIDESVQVLSNPVTPSPSNPLQVQITWTVENNADATLDQVLLFLPRIEPPSSTAPDYTGIPVEILWDPTTFVVVQYPDPVAGLESYLAFYFQDLSAGEQTSVTFQYSVLGPLPPDPTTPGSLGAPIFQVAAATRFFPVPEPSLAALLGAALAIGLVARRARCA